MVARHRIINLPLVALLVGCSFLSGYVFRASQELVPQKDVFETAIGVPPERVKIKQPTVHLVKPEKKASKHRIATIHEPNAGKVHAKRIPQAAIPQVIIPQVVVSPKNSTKRRGIVTHEMYDGPLAKVFQNYSYELPCLQGNPGEYLFGRDNRYGYDKKGMFYAKLSKCSSSTLSGIAIQISRNTAARYKAAGKADVPSLECFVKCDHGVTRFAMERDKSASILWTFIREPASRQVSDFFHFMVSRRGMSSTNETIIINEALKGLQLHRYMTGYAFQSTAKKHKTSEAQVAYILNAYDFIGLVERYHESLILLKMIYNLELRDILYASAKRSGGYDDGEYREKCYLIQKSSVSPAIKQWFQQSTEWSEYAKTDILLFRVVNRSIDLTIDAMGRSEVERQVHLLKQALELADEICGPTAIFPCSSEGKRRQPEETTCIAHDWACAHACIDKLDLSQFK